MDSNYSNPNRTVLTAVGLAAALGAAAYFGPKVIPSSANAQHINGGKGLAELIQSRRVNVDGGDNNTYNICGNIVATDDAEVIIQGDITINCSRDGEGRVVQRRTNTTGNYKPNTAEDTYFVGNQEIGTIKEVDPDTGKDVKYINRIEGKLDESKIIPSTYSVRLSSPTSENRGTVTIGANGDVLSADEATLNQFYNERNDNVYLIREEAGEATSPRIENNDYAGNPQVCIVPAGNSIPVAVIPGESEYLQLVTGGAQGPRIDSRTVPSTDGTNADRIIYQTLADNSKMFGVGAGNNIDFGALTTADATANRERVRTLYNCLSDFDESKAREIGSVNRTDMMRGAANVGLFRALDEYLVSGGDSERVTRLFSEDGISQIGLAELNSARRTGYTGLKATDEMDSLQARIQGIRADSASDKARSAYSATMRYLGGQN